MAYLVHTAHAQLAALWLACVGWTLTAVALGLIQWRVWQVADREVISSGVAWVGIWRTCFNSQTLVTPGLMVMHCKYISLTEAFTPPEITAGQVLMLLSVLLGLCGNAAGVYALRNVYLGIDKTLLIRVAFPAAGALYLLAAVMSLVPLVWNLNSVLTNQTINFPAEFKMPRAPECQHVGGGIVVGMVGAILQIVSGIIFCTHRLPARSLPTGQSVTDNQGALTDSRGWDNPGFDAEKGFVRCQ